MNDRTRTIMTLALPIIGGMVSQNVLNLVDLAMVATIGNAAVAAVGVGGFANFMATAFITGLSVGVQAMAARRLGEGRIGETAVPLNGALLLAAAIGIPGAIALYGVVPAGFAVLNPDPAVVEAGSPYLQARLLALPAVGMNFAFRGYWNGVNLSRLYLRTLVLMHVCNIFGNWVFIFGNLGAPTLGAEGAGIASALSTYVGTAYYFWLALGHAREAGFLRGLPGRDTFRTIARLAIPNGVQQTAFAAGFTALFWIIAHIGLRDGELATTEVAAANAIINLTLVAYLPGIALGIAAASLVGQALGRGQPEDAYRWGWNVVSAALVVLGLLGLPMVLVPELVLAPFLHDPSTLAVAVWPLRVTGSAMGIEAVALVLQNALMGAGATRATMALGIAAQWGLFLPVAFLLGPVLGYGLLAIWVAQVGYRMVVSLALVWLWNRRRWISETV